MQKFTKKTNALTLKNVADRFPNKVIEKYYTFDKKQFRFAKVQKRFINPLRKRA